MLNFPVYRMPYAAGIQELSLWQREREEPRAAGVTLNAKTVNMLKDDRGISFGDKSIFPAYFFERN